MMRSVDLRRTGRTLRALRGFTLTELLVVIAITTILLGLLFIPIINGFNITRKAQAEAQAQRASRTGLGQIVRDLSQATYVFDNTNAPILIPLKFTVNQGTSGPATDTPSMLFGRIDFIASATQRVGGQVIDPTTGDAFGGSPLRLPLAPGTRVVRYFLGLKRNLNNGVMARYENIYEFRGDQGQNPLVLYRAEYDPADPNLFVLANYNSALVGSGGFNDPGFFYNTAVAPNGLSYAENWKRVSTVLVDGYNQDMLAWRKDSAGDLSIDAPMRPLVQFQPGTIVGDTATPGFLNASASEVPGAIPTLYTTQQANWVLPYTVTVFRGATLNDPTQAQYGSLSLRVENEIQPDGTTRVRVRRITDAGSLATNPASQMYCIRDPRSAKMFIKTPNLTLQLDPSRGRIETAFPPLAGNANGVPLVSNGSSANPAQVGEYPNNGITVPTIFLANTRDPRAGDGVFPTNQGIWGVSLFDSPGYFFNPIPGGVRPVAPGAGGAYPSPLVVFGNVLGGNLAPGGGLLIAAGSEQVMGPDLSVSSSSLVSLVSYYRAPGATGSVLKRAASVDDNFDTNNPRRKRYTPTTGERTYSLEQDTLPNRALLRFDEASQSGVNMNGLLLFNEAGAPGLPARAVTDPNAVPERELMVDYLWQNNYARRVGGAQNGWPLDAQGRTLFDLASGGDRQTLIPEPDVIKVDYSTRALINVNFGVNVYDSNTRRASNIQLNDRVKVGNLGR